MVQSMLYSYIILLGLHPLRNYPKQIVRDVYKEFSIRVLISTSFAIGKIMENNLPDQK